MSVWVDFRVLKQSVGIEQVLGCSASNSSASPERKGRSFRSECRKSASTPCSSSTEPQARIEYRWPQEVPR
jgi:hypothetical protein